LSREALSEREGRRWTDIVSFTINMEQIGDIIERVLQDIGGQEDQRQGASSPTPAWPRSAAARAAWSANLRLGMSVFLNGNLRDAQRCWRRRPASATWSASTPPRTWRGLRSTPYRASRTSSLHLDLIQRPRAHEARHVCSIALPILDSAGALAPNRAAAVCVLDNA